MSLQRFKRYTKNVWAAWLWRESPGCQLWGTCEIWLWTDDQKWRARFSVFLCALSDDMCDDAQDNCWQRKKGTDMHYCRVIQRAQEAVRDPNWISVITSIQNRLACVSQMLINYQLISSVSLSRAKAVGVSIPLVCRFRFYVIQHIKPFRVLQVKHDMSPSHPLPLFLCLSPLTACLSLSLSTLTSMTPAVSLKNPSERSLWV